MDYGMEIINKETNQRCDHVSFDNILDIDLLENSFDEIHTFIFDKLSTSEDWQQYLIGRPYPDDLKFEFVKEERQVISLSADDYVWDSFSPIKKLIVELLGSTVGIQEVQIFFDGIIGDKPAVQSSACHVDEDNFIWIKLNHNRTLTVLERDEKSPFGYTISIGDKFSYFSPIGFFHDPPAKGLGIAMRISLRTEWFGSENKSEKCKELIEYIKSFSYKSKIATGNKKHKRLPFIDYCECVSREQTQARFEKQKGFCFYESGTNKTIILSEDKS